MAGTGITQKKSLKEIIAEEYKKCATDPIHFMKKYCMIQHPVRGKIPFHLFPFQESTLTQFAGNRFNIVLKSRQTGISTLSAGYALWKMLFNTDFNVLVIAAAVKSAEDRLGDSGRVLLRASGTEPLVRVMVEAASDSLAQEVAQHLANTVKNELE